MDTATVVVGNPSGDQHVAPFSNTETSTPLHLPYVEVRPICRGSNNGSPALTSAFVKIQLMRATCRAALVGGNTAEFPVIHIKRSIRTKWQASSDPTDIRLADEVGVPIELSSSDLVGFPLVSIARPQDSLSDIEQELLCFPTNDPSFSEAWPCECRGFVRSDELVRLPPGCPCRVLVTESTLVRALPCHDERCGCDSGSTLWNGCLTGECPVVSSDSRTEELDGIWSTQNPTTVQELTLRMQRLLAEPIYIGTTAEALQQRRRQHADKLSREQRIRVLLGSRVESSSGCHGDAVKARAVARHNAASSTLLRDGALLVHSPDHGAGKTEVIKAIARCRLGRRPVAVHVIRPDAMLARYGIHADTALQCVVHAIAMQAAVRRQAVCIVLDGLEVVLSPTKGDGGGGDAAVPVLHGMASYIQTLSTSLLHQRELPFPRNNPLYNMNEHEYGLSLPVQMMLVAVMTCPDNRWSRDTGNTLTSCMGMYRLPNLTSTTRLAAFQWAFQKEGLVLSDAVEKRLPYMAASAVWARGAEFRRMARRIRSQVDKSRSVLPTAESKPGLLASVGDVESEFLSLGRQGSSSCSVQFLADSNVDNLFDAVGGNEEAKAALTDALALDADRRRLIASFGLKPATGILLYGPPGTGKTLLAKAVAKILRSGGGSSSVDIGGAFISLSSSDIVRAEVGTSEKLVSAAFQTARANSPSVVFIDEFQALFTERNRGGSGRLSTTLLQCMDDLNQWRDIARRGKAEQDNDWTSEVRVLVLAATNTPWALDRSFLRSGRFDRAVHVGLPDAEERKAILALYMGRMKMDAAIDIATYCDRLSKRLDGFSGADLSALCRAAAMRCLVEGSQSVNEEHFDAVLNEGFAASSSRALVERIKQWRP